MSDLIDKAKYFMSELKIFILKLEREEEEKDKIKQTFPEWIVGHAYKDRKGDIWILSEIDEENYNYYQMTFLKTAGDELRWRNTDLFGKFMNFGEYYCDIIEKVDMTWLSL